MSKSEAREAVDRIVTEVNAKRNQNQSLEVWRVRGRDLLPLLQPEVEGLDAGKQREQGISPSGSAVSETGSCPSFRRDELQDLLDEKAKAGLSFSVVDHLRWDMKQIFDMAVAEGHVERNPALLLFTPKEAAKPVRRVMTMKEVQTMFCRSRSAGAVDREARDSGRDAAR